jgi:hypothetical protein
MTESPIILDQLAGKKYLPPLTGSLYIILSDEFNISSQKILSSEDHSHMVEFVKYGVENVSKALKFSIANIRVREKEALQLHELMNTEIKNDVTVAEMLLAQIADPHDARSYIQKVFGYDHASIKRLEFNLGHAMSPILGMCDGYYHLDLSVASDRVCLKKLLEQSQQRKDRCIRQSLFEPGLTGDLSQNGDWSSFRNSFYNGSQCYIRPDLFSPMPETGIVSFDFFGSERPPRGVTIIPDSRCLNIMTNANLIAMEEKVALQLLLNAMKLKAKRSFQFNGDPEGDKLYLKEKAEDIQLVMLVFYQMLPKRGKYYKMVRKLESDTGGIVKHAQQQERKLLEKEEKKKSREKKLGAGQKKGRETVQHSSSESSGEEDGDSDSDVDVWESQDKGLNLQNSTLNPFQSTVSSPVAVGRRFSMLRRESVQGVRPLLSSISSPLTKINPQPLNPLSFPSLMTHLSASPPPIAEVAVPRQRKLAISSTGKQEYIYDISSNMAAVHEAKVNKFVKCFRIVESLVDVLSRLWIRCRHLAVIVRSFNQGRVDKVKYFGTYRVELIVRVYCRLVDLHNFELILENLSAFEIGCLNCRIGLLHHFNPLKLDSWHCLDLSKREERIAAKVLAYLSTVENGKNWIEPTFRWAYQLPCIPGWMLTQSWLEDGTMPFRGILTVEYYSGQGRGLLGCNPLVPVRKSLLALVCALL